MKIWIHQTAVLVKLSVDVLNSVQCACCGYSTRQGMFASGSKNSILNPPLFQYTTNYASNRAGMW